MKHVLTEQVREAGYEALFLVGGFLALSVHPTSQNLEKIFRWTDEAQTWRSHLRRLKAKGLIEGELGKGEWVGRVTALGSSVFAGGRQPEEAWNRGWDGEWRLLSFDLPRGESAKRMKLRRWLCGRWFGRLQGSVWVCPDPVADIGGMIADEGIDASAVMVFEGNLAGKPRPREVAAMAWDFESINAGYGRYADATNRVLQQIQRKSPTPERVRDILRMDRKDWLEAVRRDPLLPKEVLPTGYEGTGAWKARGRLMAKLGKAVEGLA